MTPTELKAIRERCEKATPGPWEAHIQTGPYRTRNYAGKVKAPIPIGEHSSFRVHPNLLYEGDVHFIAHARTDIPSLLDEVERLREALEWYGDEKNWKTVFNSDDDTVYGFLMKEDCGDRARDALKEGVWK